MKRRNWFKKIFYDFSVTSNESAKAFVSNNVLESKSQMLKWMKHDSELFDLKPKNTFAVKITVEKIRVKL